MTYRTWLTGLVCATVMLLSVGCRGGDTGETNVQPPPPASPQEIERQVAEVRNNPNIPENQKQAIIARIQSQRATGGEATARQGAGQAAPPR